MPLEITHIPHDQALLRLSLRGAIAGDSSKDRISVVRLPEWTRNQYDDVNVWWASACASGARLEFTTRATQIRLHAKLIRPSREGLPLRDHVFAVDVDGAPYRTVTLHEGGDIVHLDASGGAKVNHGGPTTVAFELEPTDVQRRICIWLPHNSHVELLGVDADSGLLPAPLDQPRWVHYGSSISHSGEADTPRGIWPARAAARLGLDLYSLGLAGAAHLDGFAARTIRDQDADLITIKIGINIVNGGTFRTRTFTPAVHNFLDTIREGHPQTPIAVISPIFCPAHEDQPGPTEFDANRIAHPSSVSRRPGDGQLTLEDIRARLEDVVMQRASSDANVRYINGLDLLGGTEAGRLPDGLHPDEQGIALIARQFASHITVQAMLRDLNKPATNAPDVRR